MKLNFKQIELNSGIVVFETTNLPFYFLILELFDFNNEKKFIQYSSNVSAMRVNFLCLKRMLNSPISLDKGTNFNQHIRKTKMDHFLKKKSSFKSKNTWRKMDYIQLRI